MARQKGKSKPSKPASRPPPAEPKAFLACAHGINLQHIRSHGPIPDHPECFERVEACVERLRANSALWPVLKKLEPRRASDAEILLCHEESHLKGLQKLVELAIATGKPQFVPSKGSVCISDPGAELSEEGSGGDTYVFGGTLEAARYSAGGLLQAVDEMLSETLRCGLVLCRPPGHHASKNRSSGFCLLNNVAVAAEYALRSPKIRRVLIFDWDVHHGNGTQKIFEQSAEVLFVSFHRHDGTNFYPATGIANESGFGAGRGTTVNVALPAGFGDLAMWSACAQVLLPACRSFKPDLILVSAGFDAVEGDPLGGCCAAPETFGLLALELRRLASETAEGRIAFALEGGYDTQSLAKCVEEVAWAVVQKVADGEPFADPADWFKGPACHGAIRKTCEIHKGPPLHLPVPPSKKERRQPRRPSDRSDEEVAKALADPVATLEVLDGTLRVRIAPLAQPKDALVSRDEIRVTSGSAEGGRKWRWRVAGAHIAQAEFECARYSRTRLQLSLCLAMGEILGGPLHLIQCPKLP